MNPDNTQEKEAQQQRDMVKSELTGLRHALRAAQKDAAVAHERRQQAMDAMERMRSAEIRFHNKHQAVVDHNVQLMRENAELKRIATGNSGEDAGAEITIPSFRAVRDALQGLFVDIREGRSSEAHGRSCFVDPCSACKGERRLPQVDAALLDVEREVKLRISWCLRQLAEAKQAEAKAKAKAPCPACKFENEYGSRDVPHPVDGRVHSCLLDAGKDAAFDMQAVLEAIQRDVAELRKQAAERAVMGKEETP